MDSEELNERISELLDRPGNWWIIPNWRIILIGLPNGKICAVKGNWKAMSADRIEKGVIKILAQNQ